MLRSSTGRRSQMRSWFAKLLYLCLMTSYAVAQNVPASDPKHTHPAPGTSMVRFSEIDEGVYKGSKPKSDAAEEMKAVCFFAPSTRLENYQILESVDFPERPGAGYSWACELWLSAVPDTSERTYRRG